MMKKRLLVSAIAIAWIATTLGVGSYGASGSILSNELLTISQMPLGWSVVSNSSGSSDTGCLKNLFAPRTVTRLSKVEVGFVSANQNQGLIEAIASYTSVKRAYMKVISTLSSCRAITGTSSGYAVTGSVGAMSFPTYGKVSKAFLIKLKFQGQSITDFMVIAKVSSVLMGIQDFSSPGPSLSQFEGFVGRAVDDIQGGHLAVGSSTTTTKPPQNSSSTLAFKDSSGNPYTVTVLELIDPAQGADQFMTPDAGKRFVSVKFRIANTGTRQISDDANNNATLIGSNGQTYSADFDSAAGCTNFNDGEYQLFSGQSATGCVMFQVPKAIAVKDVEWSPNGGFGGGFGEWRVT